MLKGIDIASHQEGIDLAKVPSDFVIVKATGGVSYRNPCFKAHVDAALKAGKKLGVYHYAYERTGWGSPEDEADFFLKAFEPYVGKAIPVLDFEADVQQQPVSWAKRWLDRVYAKTGVKPWFYAYASYLNSRDHSTLHGYPLWMASYLPKYSWKGYQNDPDQIWPIAGWPKLTCYQYTSDGLLKNWGSRLDLNVFYGTGADWDAMCAGKSAPKQKVDVGKVAAMIHADMCNDDDNGYSWSPRWGEDGKGIKTITIGTKGYQYDRGSYECGTSVTTAWKAALAGTKWEHSLDTYVNSRNAKEVYLSTGLFEWKPMSFLAEPGDIYLNVQKHLAMCQSQVPDVLSEFSWGDNGAYGNKVGDQSGKEASVHGFYDYPWDGILHYNGKADWYEDGAAPSPTPEPSIEVRFRVKQDGKWQKEGFCGTPGKHVQGIAIDMPGWYQVCTKDHGWLDRVDGYNVNDPMNGYAGWLDSPVIAVRCYYKTPNPDKTGYKYAEYRVSDMGKGFWPWQRDNETTNGQDGYAGAMRPIDRFELKIV